MTSIPKLPQPAIINRNSERPLNWGVIGAGGIAKTFTSTVVKHTNHKIAAVASRTPGKAKNFTEQLGSGVAYDSYEAMLADPEVDAVYIATIPGDHLEHALLAIEAGKPVLIEKPITLNSKDAETLFAAAKAKGVLAMEAMWTAYQPQTFIAKEAIAQGQIGEIKLVVADFLQSLDRVDRLWQKGGGSPMFDCGIYPVTFAYQYLGLPDRVRSIGKMGRNGYEAEAIIYFEYDSGASAVLTMSMNTDSPNHGTIGGSQGTLEFKTPFFVNNGVSLLPAQFNTPGEDWLDETGVVGHEGLVWQAVYFADYLANGLTDSPVHGAADTVTCLKLVETIRDQLGAPAA
ncbi:MAG: Gfo/Idh/MocA family oxidoreductase [Actinomycetes bacterium]